MDLPADVDPVATERKTHSWSADLESPAHATDRHLVVAQAREAVRLTAAGAHVNLVTHGEHGHPEEYLFDALERMDIDLVSEYVSRCGCGGHVTRVHIG